MIRRRLGLENLENRDLLTTLFVSSDADTGAGSFREAIETANADSEVERIAFLDDVDTVEIASSVEYTGNQDLVIHGRGATLTTTSDAAGAIDLLVSSGDANLRIRDMVFAGGATGIYAPIGESAVDTIHYFFRDVTVRDNELFGIHLDDQINDSDASLKMMMRNSTVTGNGTGDLDFDGVRVDEGGLGDIHAIVVNSIVDENGGDGLELDERDDGRVWMYTRGSSYDGNGFFNADDLDDGLDIDEAGAGDLLFKAADSTFNGNFDQGLDLDEEQAGSARVHLFKVTANNNVGEGIKVDEKFDDDQTGSDGNLFALFIDVTANLNQSEEGIALSEEGDGGVLANLVRVTAQSNGKSGIAVDELGTGNLRGLFLKVNASDNGDDGIELTELGAGRFSGLGNRITANNNAGFGLELEQEFDSFKDRGTFILRHSDLSGNTDGEIDANGVTVF